jgi:hypothetical protein
MHVNIWSGEVTLDIAGDQLDCVVQIEFKSYHELCAFFYGRYRPIG